MTDKRTESIEGKKPWEQGFCEEEHEQKVNHRKKKGDDEGAIKNSLILDQLKGKK